MTRGADRQTLELDEAARLPRPVPAPRIVITGLGALSGFGHGVAALLAGLRRGVPAFVPLTVFAADRHRTRIAGQVPDLPLRAAERGLSRGDRFAVHAAREAVAHAGLPASALRTAGVFFASSNGGLLEGEAYFGRLRSRQRRADAGLRSIASHQNNGPGDAVARALRCIGPVITCSSACTSANMALATALDALRQGECDVAVAGGADALSEITYAGFNALRAVDPMPARPFAADRAGLSLGEGAGVLVLETEAHARGRAAPALAELAGAAATCDAHHMSAPKDDAVGPLQAMRDALADAGEPPAEVSFVNAHGTGTLHNDAVEVRALRALLGDGAMRVPVTSTKSLIGHLLGACGGVEAVASVLGLMHGEVHPTAGTSPLDPELIVDVVRGHARSLPGARVALSNNLAFGGNNCAVVLRRVPS